MVTPDVNEVRVKSVISSLEGEKLPHLISFAKAKNTCIADPERTRLDSLNEKIIKTDTHLEDLAKYKAEIAKLTNGAAKSPHIEFVDHLSSLKEPLCLGDTFNNLDKLVKNTRLWSALLAHTLAGNIHEAHLAEIDGILSRNRPSNATIDKLIEKCKSVPKLTESLPRLLTMSLAELAVSRIVTYSKQNDSFRYLDPLGDRLNNQHTTHPASSKERDALLNLHIEVGKIVLEREKELPLFSQELKKLILSARLSPLERFLTAELLTETDKRTGLVTDSDSTGEYIRFAKCIELLKFDACSIDTFNFLQELTKKPQFWCGLLANTLNGEVSHITNYQFIDKLLHENKQALSDNPQASALLDKLSGTKRALAFFPQLLGAIPPVYESSADDGFSLSSSDL